jgi:electron transfer flavoprotein beta subunit
MNIVVCISSVPDTTSKINFLENGSKFDTAGVQFVINPYDEFGLTKAINLKEDIGGKVIVITVGDISVEPVIRKALAIGADEAVRINMSPKDSYSTASEISNYLSQYPAELIITGKESSDYNGGVVGGMLAELLDLPFINACNGLNVSTNSVDITREIDGGKENISLKLPFVIGGQKGLVEESELRIPNMRGIMQARTKVLKVIEPSTRVEALTSTINFEKPATKQECKLVSSDNVAELVSLLNNEAKVI